MASAQCALPVSGGGVDWWLRRLCSSVLLKPLDSPPGFQSSDAGQRLVPFWAAQEALMAHFVVLLELVRGPNEDKGGLFG